MRFQFGQFYKKVVLRLKWTWWRHRNTNNKVCPPQSFFSKLGPWCYAITITSVMPICSVDRVRIIRDGFRERGALGHLSFWGPTQVWHIWPFVWKAWKFASLMCSASSKIYLLLCRLWFCNCLRSSTEIRAFPTFPLKNKWHCDLFVEFTALAYSSEVLFVKFPRFLAF